MAPSLQAVKGADAFRSSSAVWLDGVDYRPRQLAVRLVGPEFAVEAHFEGVLGYRVLDERDIGFAFESPRSGAWLFKVASGGWLSQETGRAGFISHQTFNEVAEYLVTSESECVSVLVDHRRSPSLRVVRSNTSLERTRER